MLTQALAANDDRRIARQLALAYGGKAEYLMQRADMLQVSPSESQLRSLESWLGAALDTDPTLAEPYWDLAVINGQFRRDSPQRAGVSRKRKRSAIAQVPEPAAAVRLISGCQDNQLSLDGTFNGLFTSVLLRVWNDGLFRGDYKAFYDAILRRMLADQSLNHLVIGRRSAEYDAERPFRIC